MNRYLSLVKFAHTVFALPFAFLAFFLGMKSEGGDLNWFLLILVFLCMIFARSAAMAFNRFVDRDIDALNQRTVLREIPAGVIKPAHAMTFVVIMSLAFVVTTYFINPLCFFLSPIILLVLLGYSYTKRFTWLSHFVLGASLGLAPIGAYVAVTGQFALLPVLYGVMVLLWVSGFDILYALQDEDFDRSHALHSIPEKFGKENAKRISIIIHALCACLLGYITWFQSHHFPTLGILHWIGAIGFIGLLFRQHLLVYQYDLQKINQAFFESNGIASILFGTTVIVDVLF